MAAGTVDNDNTDALLKGRGKTEKEDREMAPDWATPAVAAHIQVRVHEGRGERASWPHRQRRRGDCLLLGREKGGLHPALNRFKRHENDALEGPIEEKQCGACREVYRGCERRVLRGATDGRCH
jgi:hypothetical protein